MRIRLSLLTAVVLMVGGMFAHADELFEIQVIDGETGRGVPLVEVRTVDNVAYYTDSAGRVAIDDPSLMGTHAFFHISSHGYTHAAGGFGERGRAIDVEPGGSAVLEIERRNIAERLYRVTGRGIYAHSVRLGHEPPLEKPLLNAKVVGQDSTQTIIYNGRIFWFWGDTSRIGFPLGNFRTTAATSPLPEDGGLDPGEGVNLDYFENDDGFVRSMAPLPSDEGNLIWIDRVITVPDDSGRERLVVRYAHLAGLGEMIGGGLMVFNDETGRLDILNQAELHKPSRHSTGHATATRYEGDGGAHWLFAQPWPTVRVREDWQAVQDPQAYESFTCLVPGTAFDGADSRVHRNDAGELVWQWRADAEPLSQQDERELIDAGLISEEEARFQLRDVDSGEPVVIHGGTVRWNDHRERWVMIGNEIGGRSFLGEVWFAEAESPTGPWRWAKRIVTHEDYSFYNPSQHAFFDEDRGRVIYFEGTYTHQFTGGTPATPLYDYNQIMYRLDLDDDRLGLPLER